MKENFLKGKTAVNYTTIDDALDTVFQFMKKYEPNSEEFSQAADNARKLCEAREKFTKGDQNLKELCEPKTKITPQLLNILTIVVPAITGIGQILLILNHEELHVITTKALNYVTKGRF